MAIGHAEQSGNNYVINFDTFESHATAHPDDQQGLPHNAYYKLYDPQNGYLVFWDESNLEWVILDVPAADVYDGATLVNGYTNRVPLATNSQVRPSSFKSMQGDDSKVVGVAERMIDVTGISQVDDSKVTGLAERSIENNEITQALKAGESTVTNTAKISRRPIVAAVKCSDSQVVGTGENIVVNINRPVALKSGPSTVTAVVEISSNVLDGTLESGDSRIVGVAERTINTFEGIAQVQDSRVTGVSERTINGSGVLVSDDSHVVGDAERVLNNDGITHELTVGDSKVTGTAEREIDQNDQTAALKCSDSKVECTIYQTLGDQTDIPASSTLRIIEEEVRTILVRTAA